MAILHHVKPHVCRGKIAQCYFAIWRQNSPNGNFFLTAIFYSFNGYFAASAKIALTLISNLALTLTQTEEKHYFASGGKIATSMVNATGNRVIIG